MKKTKVPKFSHTSNSAKGMGDYYGTGIKNKIGKMISGTGMVEVGKEKLKSPPKSLA